MPLIRAEGFIFVTANGRDFLRLYAEEVIHSGLIIVLDANDGSEAQVLRFGLAMDRLESVGNLVNKVLFVRANNQIEISDLPSAPEPDRK